MKSLRRIFLTGLLAMGPILVSAHPDSSDAASLGTQVVVIGGRVQHSLTLSPQALAEFPVQTPPEIPIRDRDGKTIRILKAYAGVKLVDLLDKAAFVVNDHNDLKKTLIVAIASDGYKVIFSWSELYNTSVGNGVLVLYAKDGKPLGEDEGRIALISVNDLHTGARHVRWLKTLQILNID